MLARLLRDRRVQLLTFDVTHTLIQPTRPIGELYLDAMEMVASSLSSAERSERQQRRDEGARALQTHFLREFDAQDRAWPCFGAGGVGAAAAEEGGAHISAREWWHELVRSAMHGAAEEAPLAVPQLDTEAVDRSFDILYDDVFTTTKGWQLEEQARAVLEVAEEWKRRSSAGDAPAPAHIGVISNFTTRLQNVLDVLGILPPFDFLLTSHAVGVAKPHHAIFDKAREQAGLQRNDGARSLHIGDNLVKDAQGALAAGWDVVLLGANHDPDAVDALAAKHESHGVQLHRAATLSDLLRSTS